MKYKLRPDQKTGFSEITKAIRKGKGEAKGRVVIPTGGGKTFIEAATLKHVIEKKKHSRIHLVLAPRILLANQLMKSYRDFIGNSYRAIAFHSGITEQDYEKIKWKEQSTTQLSVVESTYKLAIAADQDLVVFSTYHSAAKLLGVKFGSMIADESQYCVGADFYDAVSKMDAKVKLFFTATEKHTASNRGRGLNNESIYGPRLHEITPAELIKLGVIVPPRLHIMYANTNDEEKSIVSEVIEIAKEQVKITVDAMGFSKILYAMKGTDDVKTVEDNLKRLRDEFPNHEVFTITSKNGARKNGVKMARENFITEVTQSSNALIFHYDILSEGIDIDGITGVALMRNLGLAKLIQTIGRAVRLYKANPGAKRWALISVPVINGDEDDKENVKYYIQAIRQAGYDISAEDVVETGKPRHIADPGNIDDGYGNTKNNFNKLFLTEVLHELEQESFLTALPLAETDEEKLNILFA